MTVPNLLDPSTLTDPLNRVLYDVYNRVQSIAVLTNRVLRVFDPNDAMDKLKGLQSYPGVGIIYEGTRSVDEHQPSAKIGVMGDMVISIVVLNTPNTMINADTKTPTINLLNLIRQSLLGQKGPSGHFYRFIVEAAAVESKGAVIWVQRWSIPVALVQGPINPLQPGSRF